jgi:hypothetical protein
VIEQTTCCAAADPVPSIYISKSKKKDPSIYFCIFVIGPLNQCRALITQDETTRINKPPTATGV